MKTKSEGIKRLSVLLGIIGITSWLIFAFFASYGFEDFESSDSIIVITGAILSFAIPFFIVRGIHWIHLGFQKDSKMGE